MADLCVLRPAHVNGVPLFGFVSYGLLGAMFYIVPHYARPKIHLHVWRGDPYFVNAAVFIRDHLDPACGSRQRICRVPLLIALP
jgi:cbb3-type cytochrome oxidase subunit 1